MKVGTPDSRWARGVSGWIGRASTHAGSRLGCDAPGRRRPHLEYAHIEERDRAGTSNGPTEAINGCLEHLRGSALGSAISPTTSQDHYSRPADSDPNYTPDSDEPVKYWPATAQSAGTTSSIPLGTDQHQAAAIRRAAASFGALR